MGNDIMHNGPRVSAVLGVAGMAWWRVVVGRNHLGTPIFYQALQKEAWKFDD